MKCERCRKVPGCSWINNKFICKRCFEKVSWELGAIRRERKRLELAAKRGSIPK